MELLKYIPALEWISNYRKQDFQHDLIAGLTVGVMLIPQGMAYAMIAGLPPIYGLYASTLPLLIYALLGTSRQLAVGPVAMVSLLTAAGVSVLAESGTDSYISLAITLALLVGIIQFLLGLFRMGFLVSFLSHPIISGFTSAAALIIGLSQLKHLLGVEMESTHFVHEVIIQAIEQFQNIHWSTFLLGLGGILLIIGVKRWIPAIPGPLIAVLFGTLAVWALGNHLPGIKIVGSVPSGLPSFAYSSFQLEWTTIQQLLPIAFAISLVSFMESIAVAKAIQTKHKDYELVPNQELIALGLANIGGALFQSFPVTGGFSRTAVNDQAGAKTGLAAIISALLIVLTLLFLTPLFYFLPKAILASVIMVAVFGLIDLKEARHLWKVKRSDFWMLLVTFVATLTLGIELGIGTGLLLSLIMIIFRSTRPHMARLGRVPDTPYYRNLERFPSLLDREDILVLRFDAQLYFANIDYFTNQVKTFTSQQGKNLKAIVLNFESISYIDSSALHGLDDLLKDLTKEELEVYFSGIIGPVRDTLDRAGLLNRIGTSNHFISVQEAVDYFDLSPQERQLPKYGDYVMQANGS